MFAQDEGGEGLVGYADVQVNLKDVNDNAPFFQQNICYGNITENGEEGIGTKARNYTGSLLICIVFTNSKIVIRD